ncbi:MAG: hypothetical protein K0Q59_824, partial [Paenibacillus sp.]|nr:hypothetical protein [Paenibacillus sp.]
RRVQLVGGYEKFDSPRQGADRHEYRTGPYVLGEPDHMTANSYIAQWVYQYDRFNAQYLYFTDGVLELFY